MDNEKCPICGSDMVCEAPEVLRKVGKTAPDYWAGLTTQKCICQNCGKFQVDKFAGYRKQKE